MISSATHHERSLVMWEGKDMFQFADPAVTTAVFSPDTMLPLVVRPLIPDVDLIGWSRRELDNIETALCTHGAILFRDFQVDSPERFTQFAQVLSPALLNYVEGSSPRTQLGDRVYTSTEYPPAETISMHNELSYAHKWPGKIFFYCVETPGQGGETPLADSRKVLARLDPELKARFVSKGVRYTRNLHGDRGIGLSWQDVFETDDRSVVEAYCREGEIDFVWQTNGGLWTSQVRPAVVTHPKTGETVWFNQVDQWHPSNLDPKTARALLALRSEDQLPIYASYGDGTPFDDHEMNAIRATFQEETVTFPWQPGDVLAVDNMLAAHGRRPFVGSRKVLVMMGSPTQ